jgi:hypothetical protein
LSTGHRCCVSAVLTVCSGRVVKEPDMGWKI